jgi:serine/threonine-protein kinase
MPNGPVSYCPRCRRHLEAGRAFCPRDGTPLLPFQARPPVKGELLDQRFMILEAVGKGGMASVLGAFDRLRNRECAVKLLRRHCAEDLTAIRQFFAEARCLRGLSHPGIVKVHAFGTSLEGYPYMAMELLKGRTLADELKTRECLPIPEAFSIMLQLLSAMDHAHARGVIHRDLKPENIYISRAGGKPRVKLLDFGIAQDQDCADLHEGEICGTPTYMSPEQIRNLPVGVTSDIYSAAVLFFEMLCGRTPFQGDKPVDLMRAHVKNRAPRLSMFRKEAAELDLLMARMLAKEPGKRPASAREVAWELRRVAGLPDPVGFLESPPVALPQGTSQVEVGAAGGNLQLAQPVCAYAREKNRPGGGDYRAVNADQLRVYADLLCGPRVLEQELARSLERPRPSIMHGAAYTLDEESLQVERLLEERLGPDYPRAVGRDLVMVHMHFDCAGAEATDCRALLAEDLELFTSVLAEEGMLVVDDLGTRFRILVDPAVYPEPRDAVEAALGAALDLMTTLENLAAVKVPDLGIRAAVVLGRVFADGGDFLSLASAVAGSRLEISERLAALAPPGALVLDGACARVLGDSVETAALGFVAERCGGRTDARIYLGPATEVAVTGRASAQLRIGAAAQDQQDQEQ